MMLAKCVLLISSFTDSISLQQMEYHLESLSKIIKRKGMYVKKVLLLKRHTECLNRTDLCEKEMMRDTFRHANGSHGSID